MIERQAALSARRTVPLTAVERSPLPPPAERLFGPPRKHVSDLLDAAFPDFDHQAYVTYHTSLEGQSPEELLTHYKDRGWKQRRCASSQHLSMSWRRNSSSRRQSGVALRSRCSRRCALSRI